MRKDSVQLADGDMDQLLVGNQLLLIRSLRDRMLIVPESDRIPHWFFANELGYAEHIAFQRQLILTAIDLCRHVETYFPGLLTSDQSYQFEFHVGSQAGQTIPYLHLRVIGGVSHGLLTDKEWKTLTLIDGGSR